MIVELTIRNFAIIPSLTVSFQKGLHVLTGETGAGKSIIIDAISTLIGGRASVDYVRHGEKKAEIEGLFELPSDHPAFQLCQQLGIEGQEEALILRRDISNQGKSICRINGKLVTLAILREVGQLLLDIHGQHEYQNILREENHLSLLDTYGNQSLKVHHKEYQHLHKQYKQLNQTIKQLTENEQQLAHRLDLLRFQWQEINEAQLELGEDTELYQEKRKRIHSQKLFQGVHESYEAVMDDGRALSCLSVIMSSLQDLAHIDEELKPSAELVENMYYQLEDLGFHLIQYKDNLEFDSERLNQIESRLIQIDQLKRKYGSNVEEILEYAATIEEELDSIEHKEERIDDLLHKREELVHDLVVEAENMTKLRSQVAKQLVGEIKQELTGLYMDETEIDIRMVPLTTGEKIEYSQETRYINQRGWDEVQFLIAPNPGEALKPLAKIASGGELSRLILALKTVFSKTETVNTLIFDEVDTGVSGRVAQAMAEKLYKISKNHQVLCISHHAQVAAMSDEHYRIQKEISANETTTTTTIIPLSDEEKVMEIAKLMSGVEVTEVTKEHALELLHSAVQIKQQLQK